MPNNIWIDYKEGQTFEVFRAPDLPDVYLIISEASSKPGEAVKFLDVALTRSQAREIAKALQAASEEAEAKPSKDFITTES